jgi:hypothetical protein
MIIKMALYLDIEKEGELNGLVEYRYSTTDDRVGRFTLNTRTGEVLLVCYAPGEKEGGLFQRAGSKVRRLWSAGDVPEKTYFAS